VPRRTDYFATGTAYLDPGFRRDDDVDGDRWGDRGQGGDQGKVAIRDIHQDASKTSTKPDKLKLRSGTQNELAHIANAVTARHTHAWLRVTQRTFPRLSKA
jgi:hypothetical protein